MLHERWRSKSELRQRECGDKLRHVTRKEAIIHLHKHALENYQPEVTICVYKCQFCKFWHIGHTEPVLLDDRMLEG